MSPYNVLVEIYVHSLASYIGGVSITLIHIIWVGLLGMGGSPSTEAAMDTLAAVDAGEARLSSTEAAQEVRLTWRRQQERAQRAADTLDEREMAAQKGQS